MSEKQTIAILGSGNIGLSLARGLVKAGIYQPDQIKYIACSALSFQLDANHRHHPSFCGQMDHEPHI